MEGAVVAVEEEPPSEDGSDDESDPINSARPWLEGPTDITEERLRTSPIDSAYCPQLKATGTHIKGRYKLASGDDVIVKLGSEFAGAEKQVRYEVVGWELAKLLGWQHLVPLTVLRTVEEKDQGECEASFCFYIERPYFEAGRDGPGDPRQAHPKDLWRAAALDYLLQQNNREGTNYLFKDEDLVLFDHGQCFGHPIKGCFSTFYTYWGHKIGQLGTEVFQAALVQLDDSPIAQLLTHDELKGLRTRLAKVAQREAVA